MKLLLVAAALAALPLAGFAQSPGPDLQTIQGNGGTAGAAVGTVVLPPAGGLADVCTNVTSCGSGTAPGSGGGAQVNHVVATPNGDIKATCINSEDCSAFLGR